MSKILMVASEATPFSKTGGLADVIGALPAALRDSGEEVCVLLPYYTGVAGTAPDAERVWRGMRIPLGRFTTYVDILRHVRNGVTFYFVDAPTLYARDGVYGTPAGDYPDNHLRFAALCHAALGVVRNIYRPDIIHCHDWQTGLVAPLVKHQYSGDPTFLGIKILLTIHNLGYQGLFPRDALADLGIDPSLFNPGALEFYGMVNFLKGGIVYADAISTVSPTYAREIQTPEYGFGLDGLLRARAGHLHGILNGVDYTEWSPETDKYIATNYDPRNLAGKRICKADLLKEFGLPAELDRPLIGIVSRFAGQKGFDLLESIADDLAHENLSLVVVGSGEQRYENVFTALAAANPTRVAVRVAYDNALAHKIEAGADMFLMPSRYEPCGLNQIYSLRYGTVPIVRATGGLDDTIDRGTGFKFRSYSGSALLEAIRTALAAYADKARWLKMMKAGMAKDFSWRASAQEYKGLYRRLIG
jgi:starch synthase